MVFALHSIIILNNYLFVISDAATVDEESKWIWENVLGIIINFIVYCS